MGIVRVALGTLAGAATGLLCTVVYSGPLGLPVVGLVLAFVIVASGAWAMWEWCGVRTWVPYVLGVFAVTIVFFYAPPSDDLLIGTSPYAELWIVLSALAAVLPVFVLNSMRRRRARTSRISRRDPR
ncbi:hypothetical protein [Trueperella bialowiezensis]|nr:hypothetical protein [Trueperella bialowiezensis]